MPRPSLKPPRPPLPRPPRPRYAPIQEGDSKISSCPPALAVPTPLTPAPALASATAALAAALVAPTALLTAAWPRSKLDVQRLFVLLDEVLGLRGMKAQRVSLPLAAPGRHAARSHQTHPDGQLLRELLHPRLLDPVERHDIVNLVERRRELVGPDHLGHDGDDLPLGQVKGRGEEGEGEGVVVRRIREEVRPETLLLDFPEE